jgi:outer membrane receptor protein involved in Fe transport
MLSFKEEKLKNYELGLKSSIFDGRLTANFAVFQMDWIDQVSSTTNTATNGQFYSFNANRGNSRVRGFEAQITAVPIEGLTVSATTSYNDAKYVDYCSASALNIVGYVTPGKVNCFVVNGNYLENVPPLTMSLSTDYRFDIADGWTAFAGGTYRYRSGQWAEDVNFSQSGPQNLVDLRAGVETDRITIQAFCANCTNDLSPDRATNLADVRLGSTTTLNRTVSASLKRPRQIGVRTAYKF